MEYKLITHDDIEGADISDVCKIEITEPSDNVCRVGINLNEEVTLRRKLHRQPEWHMPAMFNKYVTANLRANHTLGNAIGFTTPGTRDTDLIRDPQKKMGKNGYAVNWLKGDIKIKKFDAIPIEFEDKVAYVIGRIEEYARKEFPFQKEISQLKEHWVDFFNKVIQNQYNFVIHENEPYTLRIQKAKPNSKEVEKLRRINSQKGIIPDDGEFARKAQIFYTQLENLGIDKINFTRHNSIQPVRDIIHFLNHFNFDPLGLDPFVFTDLLSSDTDFFQFRAYQIYNAMNNGYVPNIYIVKLDSKYNSNTKNGTYSFKSKQTEYLSVDGIMYTLNSKKSEMDDLNNARSVFTARAMQSLAMANPYSGGLPGQNS